MDTIKKYFWVTHLFAIAVCAYFAAQTASTYFSMLLEQEVGVGARGRAPTAEAFQSPLASQREYAIVVDRNVFNSVDAPKDLPPPEDEERVAGDLTGPAVKTNLNIKVLGTLVVGEGKDRRSSATVVGGGNRKAEVYFAGGKETFEEGVRLIQIKRDRIEFVNRGRLEYALLEGISEEFTIFAKASEVHGSSEGEEKKSKTPERPTPSAGIKEEGGRLVIDQREVDEALTNLDQLYTQIRIVPNFRGGQPAGMKVLAVKPGSIFGKLGIKRGDILERINGLELDIKRGMELFGQLKDQKDLRIDLVRRGQNKTMEYEIR